MHEGKKTVVGRFFALFTNMGGKYYRRHEWRRNKVVIFFCIISHLLHYSELAKQLATDQTISMKLSQDNRNFFSTIFQTLSHTPPPRPLTRRNLLFFRNGLELSRPIFS